MESLQGYGPTISESRLPQDLAWEDKDNASLQDSLEMFSEQAHNPYHLAWLKLGLVRESMLQEIYTLTPSSMLSETEISDKLSHIQLDSRQQSILGTNILWDQFSLSGHSGIQ